MQGILRQHQFFIRRLACVTAFLVFLGAASASQHFHGKDCSDDVCAVCLFSDSGGDAGAAPAPVAPHLSCLPAGAVYRSPVLTSRPFEAPRTRAPPIS